MAENKPTIVQDDRLLEIVNTADLDPDKSNALVTKFSGLLAGLAEWEARAKTIKVTGPEQKTLMEMARAGRLYLRDQRVAIEKTRKQLKEQSLREGQAIDRIARTITALISPIEEYLDRQEHWVEYKEKAEREAKQREIERRMEEERVEREKQEAAERELVRVENERFRKEAETREREARLEREAHERELAEERRKARDAEEKAEAERRERERAAEGERRRLEGERRKAEEEARRVREEAEAERKRLEETVRRQKEVLADAIGRQASSEEAAVEALLEQEVECPKCHHRFRLGDAE